MRGRSGIYRRGFDPLDIVSARPGSLRSCSASQLSIFLCFLLSGCWSSGDDSRARGASDSPGNRVLVPSHVPIRGAETNGVSPNEAPWRGLPSVLGAGYVAREPRPLESLPLADLDPLNNGQVAPPEAEPDCEAALARLGAQIAPAQLPLHQKVNGAFTCGAPQAFVFKKGPLAVRYNARPIVTCRVALGLAHFERIASELSTATFGQPVSRITQLGTYNCRKMSRFRSLVSEHSYGNAIDIKSLTLKNGRVISVDRHFGALDVDESDSAAKPLSQEGKFLRALARRLYHDGVFSVVLTPFYDSLHRDHFHLDQARYRIDGTGGPFEWPSLFESR
jgi:hypothetical protein